jgi:uncharacterized protein (TIRG00374 family)
MTKNRKILLTVVKLAVAGMLLALVCSMAHWRDYVVGLKDATFQIRDGSTVEIKKDAAYVILADQPGLPATLAVREVPRVDLTSKIKPSSGLVGELASWGRRLAAPVEAFSSSASSKEPLPAATLEQARHPGLETTLFHIKKLYLALGMLGFLVSWVVVSIRWWMLLKIQDIVISPWEAIRLTFLGQFFSRIIPGTVGGDLVKAYYVSRHTPKTAAVLVSMFVDRVMGLTEMTLLAGTMVLVVLLGGLEKFENIRQPVYAVILIVALVAVALTFLLNPRFRKLFHLQKLYGRLPIAHHFAAAGDAAELYRHRLPALAKAIGMTFGSHFVWMGGIALFGYGLGLHTPPGVGAAAGVACHWYTYFLFIPLIYIMAAGVPIPGGVGSTELLYIWAFCTIAGMDPSAVLAMALLARLVELFWSLPGLLVALTSPKMPKARDMQAQLDRQEQAAAK